MYTQPARTPSATKTCGVRRATKLGIREFHRTSPSTPAHATGFRSDRNSKTDHRDESARFKLVPNGNSAVLHGNDKAVNGNSLVYMVTTGCVAAMYRPRP